MPLTYAQIRKKQALLGPDYENLSSDEFAQLMNNITGSREYDAGLGTGLGKVLKGASYAVDQGLRLTGLPQLAGELGQAGFGDAGRAAFEGAPRMAVDMLPFMRAGKIGIGLGAAAMGTNTYEKTDSPAAGVLAAGTAPLFGPLQQMGGRAAVNLGGRLGLNTARTEALAAGIGGSGLFTGQAASNMVANKMATSLVNGGVLKSGLARGVEQFGEQAGIGVANLAGQAITTAAAAPKGQRWDAVKQMFTDDLGQTLAMTALTQLPFVGMGAIKALGPQRAEVNYERQHADTLKRYDDAVYGPPRQLVLANRVRTDLQNTVATTPKALPPISGKTVEDVVREKVQQYVPPDQRLEFSVPERKAAEGRYKVVEDKLNVALRRGDVYAIDRYQKRLDKLRRVTGRDNKENVDLPVEQYVDKASLITPENSVALKSNDLRVRTKAAMEINQTTPENFSARVVALSEKTGVSLTDAATEVAATEVNKATDAKVKADAKAAKQAEVAAAKLAQEQASMKAWSDKYIKLTSTKDEITDTIESAVKQTEFSDDPAMPMNVRKAAVEWSEQYQRDPAKLDELDRMLGGVTGKANLKQPNRKSRKVVGIPHETWAAADTARNELKTAEGGDKFQWQVHAKNGKFIVVQYEHANTAEQGAGKTVVDEALTPDQQAARDEAVGMFAQLDTANKAVEDAADANVEAATQPGDNLGVEVINSEILHSEAVWKHFTNQFDNNELHEIGQTPIGGKYIGLPNDRTIQRGKDRLEAL